MASVQWRARLRAAVSSSLPAGTARRKEPGAFTFFRCACIALQATLLALSAAHAEIGPVAESESRRCGFSNYSMPLDCSSYQSVFKGIDAMCKWWQNNEAYLAYSSSGYVNNALVSYDYYKINCRTTLYPPGVNSGSEGGYLSIERTAQCHGASGWKLALPARVCERPDLPRSCRVVDAGSSTPYPILPATTEKYRSELDWSDNGPAPLSLSRTYRSVWAGDPTHRDTGLGRVWSHNHSARLDATPAGAPNTVAITSPEGQLRTFFKPAGATAWTVNDSADTLTQLASGAWTYKRGEDDAVFNFDDGGRLQTKIDRNGWATTYAYDGSDRLSTVTNALGRTLVFAYNSAGQLATVTAPDARVIGYSHDGAGRLSSVLYPDGKSRSFAYENAAYPQALTGITDESGVRWGTFTYDGQGRAVGTELAGGVSRYQVNYPSPGKAGIVDPLGTSRNFSYSATKGKLAVIGGSLPSGEGEADAASRVQDANGLITSETDFKGVVTTTTWDVARRLPLSVTRAAGTPQAQTVTTQWHPTFSLPVLVTETGRTVAYTYDDKGNVLTQSVTDTASSPNTTRTWQWTWNTQGLAATSTDPNGAVSTYTYDTLGNLTRSVNALGHETHYTYDSANRVVTRTGPSGLVTAYTWDARDRLLAQTVAGLVTTTFTYQPTGLLDTLTLPTGLSITYTYDPAHRLTGWSNNRGESGTFTLDTMGNRVSEQVRNSAGAVAWTAARSINNLNRVSARTDGPNQTNSFGYDANGERISDTNGLNQSTRYGLDPLRRVANGLTQQIGYGYTDAGPLATISYPNGDTLTRVYDATGRLTQLNWNGTPMVTGIAWNPMGQPTEWRWTFAGKLLANRSHDTAGRLTATEFASYVYDAAGRITSLTQSLFQPGDADPNNSSIASANTTWSVGYDAVGRITNFNATGSSTGFGYDANGKQAAEQWYQRAFQQEHPETLYTFALREFQGGKITEKAIALLRRAADKGFKQAEHVLREYTH